MDSLKTLMDKKQYDLVIKLTESSNDSLSLFYRISALLAVGQSKEALNVINDHRGILQSRLSLLVKIHIEILCLLEMFDEAYIQLSYYEELPYESQEVEEILKAMKDYIRKEEKNAYKKHSLSEDEILAKLMSKNDEEVLAALDSLKNQKLDNYLLALFKIMRSYPKQVVRTFALLLLVNEKYDKEIDFLYHGQLIKVVPSSLEEPFLVKGFKNLEDLSYAFQSMYHDPSIALNAMQIISSYLLYNYPRHIDMTADEVLVVFGFLAKRLLQVNTDDLKQVCESKDLDYPKISETINVINEDLKNF